MGEHQCPHCGHITTGFEQQEWEATRRERYNAALKDCIGLLRKWFWGTNKDARACEADMRALVQ